MKSLLKSQLIELMNKHRDNDVVVDFDGFTIPITRVKYDTNGDQIVLQLYKAEVAIIKNIVGEKAVKRQSRKGKREKEFLCSKCEIEHEPPMHYGEAA